MFNVRDKLQNNQQQLFQLQAASRIKSLSFETGVPISPNNSQQNQRLIINSGKRLKFGSASLQNSDYIPTRSSSANIPQVPSYHHRSSSANIYSKINTGAQVSNQPFEQKSKILPQFGNKYNDLPGSGSFDQVNNNKNIGMDHYASASQLNPGFKISRILNRSITGISLPKYKRGTRHQRAPLTVMSAQIDGLDESSSNFQVVGETDKPLLENFQDTAVGTIKQKKIDPAPYIITDLQSQSVSSKITLISPEPANTVVEDKANNIKEGEAQNKVLVSGEEIKKKPSLLVGAKQQVMKIMNNEAKFQGTLFWKLREKAPRLVQFFLVFYIPILAQQMALLPPGQQVAKSMLIKTCEGIYNKALLCRLLSWFTMYDVTYGMIKHWKDKTVKRDSLFWLQNASHSALTVFCALTHGVFFYKIGLSNMTPARANLQRNIYWQFWLLEMIFEMLAGVVGLKRMWKNLKQLYSKDEKESQSDEVGIENDKIGTELRAAEQKFRFKYRQVIRYGLEAVICLAFLEWGVPRIVGGIAGTVGAISEIIDTTRVHRRVQQECEANPSDKETQEDDSCNASQDLLISHRSNNYNPILQQF